MKKYKVTQEFMNELNKWNKTIKDNDLHMEEIPLYDFPALVDDWFFTENSVFETINRLIALMRFVNGEDVFEIRTQKYIVQIKDHKTISGYKYLKLEADEEAFIFYGLKNATRFDNFEEASEWANKHFEVVEVDE